MKRVKGFTLIELMIVVLIIAVLAALAMSSYNNQVRKSRRAEAKQVLADLGLKQEKYRSNHTTYGTIAQVGGANATSYYNICPDAAICTTSSTGYVLVAVPVGDQLKDPCATLRWEMTAGVINKTSTAGSDCW